MFYFIKSENLGWSDRSYRTYEEALESARSAWRMNPARVGMCVIARRLLEPCSDECGFCQDVHFFPEEFDPCPLCSRVDDCGHDRYEMNAVYLDAISV